MNLGPDGLFQDFYLEEGEAAYVYARGRATSSRPETMMDGLRVTCKRPMKSYVKVLPAPEVLKLMGDISPELDDKE